MGRLELVPMSDPEPDKGEAPQIALGCLLWLSVWITGVVVMVILSSVVWRGVRWLLTLPR